MESVSVVTTYKTNQALKEADKQKSLLPVPFAEQHVLAGQAVVVIDRTASVKKMLFSRKGKPLLMTKYESSSSVFHHQRSSDGAINQVKISFIII